VPEPSSDHQMIHQVQLRQRGGLGQPHRAWEGFHADPNLVFADPCQLLAFWRTLEAALGDEDCLSVQTKSQITVA
jgi:hypothetical protein